MEETSLGAFFEAWELFADAALAGALAGALLGYLGVYVVLRRLVFLSAVVAQAAGLGVALAFWLQLQIPALAGWIGPLGGAALLTALAVVPAALDRSGANVRRESILGFGYLLGAAGTLAIGTRIVQELQDIQTLLFGSAVAVLPEHFSAVLWTVSGLFLFHIWWRRGFSAVSFDPAGAQVRGLPVKLLNLGLFLSLALAVAVSTRVLGALPTFGFSVLPALAAVRVSRNVDRALWLATLGGALSGFVGYLWAYLQHLPVGAAQTLVGIGLVGLAEIYRRIRG